MQKLLEAYDTVLVENIFQLLTELGIPCEVKILDEEGLDHCFIFVDEVRFEEANDCLDEYMEKYGEENSSLHCPECRSKKVSMQDEEISGLLSANSRSFQCENCGHEFFM